ENFLSNWQSYRKGEIFIELANKRTEFLRDQAQKVGSIKDVVLLISVTIPNLNANIDDMIRRRDALKDTFRSIGLSTENVNAQQLLKFLRVIFGWPEEEHSNINQYEILSEQILSGDFSLFENDDCVNVNDDQIFISLEARNRPAEWKLSAMDLFLGNEMRRDEYIKSNFLIHFGLQILPNQAMERTAAITKREALERNINAGMGKFFS
ncbi:F pilus assembly Type-IV secretion system for plasmid transfer family protein, partial [Orientia tsutsugamushi str. Karp]